MKEPKNNRFKSFSEFEIEEKMGVPSGIVQLADEVSEFVVEAITKKGINEDQRTYNKVFTVKTPHPEFPVEQINLKIQHHLSPFLPKPFIVEGNYVGDSLTEKDGLIRFNIGVDTQMNLLTTVFEDPKPLEEKFLQEVQGLFYHELLHVYEDYQRTRKDKFQDMLHTRDFISASVSNMIRSSNPQIHPLVGNFLFCLYASASFEVRARVSQVYPFIKDVSNPRDREKIIKQSFQWHVAEQLASFKAKEFCDNLLELMGGDEEKLKGLTKNLEEAIESGSLSITKMLISQVDSPEISKDISSKVMDRISSNAKSFRMTSKEPLKFFTQWQKKFNEEGEKAKRKLSKLTTI